MNDQDMLRRYQAAMKKSAGVERQKTVVETQLKAAETEDARLTEQLKDEFGLTLEQVPDELKKLEQEIEQLTTQVETELDKVN